ncbi:MAG: pilin [Gammaproteobacteria bacterium]
MVEEPRKPVNPVTPPRPVAPPTDVPSRPVPPGNPVGIVAVVAVCVALAACGQQDSSAGSHPSATMARAEVTEAVTLLNTARGPVLQHYRSTGAWPTDAELARLAPMQSGSYSSNLRVGNGTELLIDYKGVAEGLVYMTFNPGDGSWTCGTEGLADTQVPPNCR